MVVVFRTKGEDWDKFEQMLKKSSDEIKGMGCSYVQAYRNRKHPDEWMMLQDWTDKASFDKFAQSRGPELDREAGVRWSDVSTWEVAVFPRSGG